MDVPGARAGNPVVLNAMEVDDPGQLDVGVVGPLQPRREFPEDVGVGAVRVIETRCVDEVDVFPINGGGMDADSRRACTV